MDKNYIFTSYFTTKKCPQRRKHRFGKNVYSLINTWYKSLNLLGIEGIIFYDDLSSDFISKYQNATIRFIQYDLGVRSTNDERFICYREYLLSSSHIDNCFFTDLFDVTFFKNPFLLISDDYDIYVGSENKYNVKWMRRAYMNAYGKTFYPDKKMLNAGILGGKIDNILKLLNSMYIDFSRIPTNINSNMAVLNRNVYDTFEERKILTGYPLHSKFKGFQKSGDFYIKHK